MKIKNKFTFLCIALFVGFSSILIALFSVSQITNINFLSTQILKESANKYTRMIDNFYKQQSQFLYSFVNSGEFLSYIENYNNNANSYRLNTILSDYKSESSSVVSATFYNSENIAILSSNSELIGQEYNLRYNLKSFDKNKYSSIPLIHRDEELGKTYSVTILPIYSKNIYLGCLSITFDNSEIEAMSREFKLLTSGDISFIAYSSGDVISSSNVFIKDNIYTLDVSNTLASKHLSIDIKKTSAPMEYKIENNNRLALYSYSPTARINTIVSVDKKEIYESFFKHLIIIIAFITIFSFIIHKISEILFGKLRINLNNMVLAIKTKSPEFAELNNMRDNSISSLNREIVNLISTTNRQSDKIIINKDVINSILNTIDEGFFSCTLCDDMKFILTNYKLLEMLNCSREELSSVYNNCAINMFHPLDKPIILSHIRGELEIGDKKFTIIRTDGTIVPIKIKSHVNHNQRCIDFSISDSTGDSLKNILIKSKISEAKFLEANSNIPYFRCENNGFFNPTYVNKTFLRFFGCVSIDEFRNMAKKEGSNLFKEINIPIMSSKLSEYDIYTQINITPNITTDIHISMFYIDDGQFIEGTITPL